MSPTSDTTRQQRPPQPIITTTSTASVATASVATASVATAALEQRLVRAAGTTFGVDLRGDGPPILVIHGGGEDAAMLAPLAEKLAADGHRVITYDRRGTGRSGRADWPGNGADQHADDAAAILDALGVEQAQVVGLSSGGVIALDLAVRHPSSVIEAFVWEAPALGVVPGADELHAQIMAPIGEHLAAHPGDFIGAQAILLTAILGFPVTVADPLFAPVRANAEPMIRDEPSIPLRAFTADELGDLNVTIAAGAAPNDIVAAATRELAQLIGQAPLVVNTSDHEIYVNDPAAFADALRGHR
jgi:pimeloyl-ACP methyl ester carboxylesterase